MADAVGRALFLPKDMKVWQEKRSKHMLENLKRDSIFVSFQAFYLSRSFIHKYTKSLFPFFQAVQGIFEASSQLLETKRLLNQSLEKNKQLKDLEKSASARIQAAESMHKSAEAGLMTTERQVIELKAKLDREYKTSSQLRVENSELKDTVDKAWAKIQKAEDEAQSYYDQGFDEAANSLKSQLADECNKFFLQGWRMALDKAGVDDASELYDLVPRHRPFRVDLPEEHEGGEAAKGSTVPESHEASRETEAPEDLGDPKAAEDLGDLEVDDQVSVVEVREGEDGSDGEGAVDIDD